jgi:hypothetical protein
MRVRIGEIGVRFRFRAPIVACDQERSRGLGI